MKPFPGFTLKSISVLLFLNLIPGQTSPAQVADDFSDGDFRSDPSWAGADSSFYVNDALQLQLNATAAGTSWLSTPLSSPTEETVEWVFFVKQSFSPSSANFGRFYLMSDQGDLSSMLNGYYLQFGESGSNDALELFRQTGNTSVSICRGTPGAIAAGFGVRVKVTRQPDGLWQVYADHSGGNSFMQEGSGLDATHTLSRFCGVLCTYTITNSNRFYYDDFFIRSYPAPDVAPPRLVSVRPLSAQSLRLVFSEELERASAEDTRHYAVAGGIGFPLTARLGDSLKTVELSFSTSFPNGHVSALTVEKVKDLAGNEMALTDTSFLYFQPQPVGYRDVVISEFLADPSPSVGLPDAEYVELYNAGDNVIDLAGWSFSDATSSAALTSFMLWPGKYALLTSPANAGKYVSAGDVMGVSGFPALNNTGDILVLKDADGRTIDTLRYDLSWYHDEEKAEGGWSLERIDVHNTCAGQENWVAAAAQSGGTPGKQNSVFAHRPDNTGPRVLAAYPLGTDTVVIVFDEKLENTVPTPAEFSLEPHLPVVSVQFGDAGLTTLRLAVGEPVQPGLRYHLSVHHVYDCPGNRIQENFSDAVFVLPETAAPGDIIVNEILFNPRSTGVDFVEVYNCSEKTIDTRNWVLRNPAGDGRNAAVPASAQALIYPGEYRVFTTDPQVLKGEYVNGAENNFVRLTLPALNDDEGFVVIADEQGQVIDSVQYDEKMHTPFLKDHEGVSLERISGAAGGMERSNWRSASSTSGFATPGYGNANARDIDFAGRGSVVVEPEIIQPQLNAHDFTQIKYRFDRGGFIATVRILDGAGRAVRLLAANELLGTEGFFRWDADLDRGGFARTGYYLVWFEVFDVSGRVAIYRKRVVVY